MLSCYKLWLHKAVIQNFKNKNPGAPAAAKKIVQKTWHHLPLKIDLVTW